MPSGRSLDGPTLHAAAMRRLRRRESGSGVLVIPAVPSLRAHYQQKVMDLFALLGRPFSADEIATLQEIMERLIHEA